MLRRDAFYFAKAVSDLWLMEEICVWSRKGQMDAGQVSDTRNRIVELAHQLAGLCQASDLEQRLQSDVNRFSLASQHDDLADIARRCADLRDRVLDELKNEFYLHVPNADSGHYGVRSPFGDAVAVKFPKSVDDFAHATDCLALQQPTATVFHLMRGVEAAVQRLARKLRMSVTPGSTWRQITTAMDARIAAMPNRTPVERRSKERWGDARINLDLLGSVVRNNTMHAASAYSQDEARHIFSLVREAMTRLCKL